MHENCHRTVVEVKGWSERVTRDAGILSLGSCFSTEMGSRLAEEGYGICSNPFGVLYNPASIANSIDFLAQDHKFTAEDVVPRDTNPIRSDHTVSIQPGHRPIAPEGGGYVSFYHHGSFARRTPEEFLRNANTSISAASSAFKKAGWIMVTFGTAWIFRHLERDIIVSNCHKHPAWEFRRELLTVEDITDRWYNIVKTFPDKNFIFTVSPIRHRKDGMHGNQISKAILLLAVEHLVSAFPNTHYFPAYEIVLDELRDYSWFADDLVHPSPETVNIVWERFRTSVL